jgi:hypothetical protein
MIVENQLIVELGLVRFMIPATDKHITEHALHIFIQVLILAPVQVHTVFAGHH